MGDEGKIGASATDKMRIPSAASAGVLVVDGDAEGPLKFTVEVDVRPEVELRALVVAVLEPDPGVDVAQRIEREARVPEQRAQCRQQCITVVGGQLQAVPDREQAGAVDVGPHPCRIRSQPARACSVAGVVTARECRHRPAPGKQLEMPLQLRARPVFPRRQRVGARHCAREPGRQRLARQAFARRQQQGQGGGHLDAVVSLRS